MTKLVYDGQNDHMCKMLSPGIYLLFVSEHFTQKCINNMTLEKVTGLTFCKINWASLIRMWFSVYRASWNWKPLLDQTAIFICWNSFYLVSEHKLYYGKWQRVNNCMHESRKMSVKKKGEVEGTAEKGNN